MTSATGSVTTSEVRVTAGRSHSYRLLADKRSSAFGQLLNDASRTNKRRNSSAMKLHCVTKGHQPESRAAPARWCSRRIVAACSSLSAESGDAHRSNDASDGPRERSWVESSSAQASLLPLPPFYDPIVSASAASRSTSQCTQLTSPAIPASLTSPTRSVCD